MCVCVYVFVFWTNLLFLSHFYVCMLSMKSCMRKKWIFEILSTTRRKLFCSRRNGTYCGSWRVCVCLYMCVCVCGSVRILMFVCLFISFIRSRCVRVFFYIRSIALAFIKICLACDLCGAVRGCAGLCVDCVCMSSVRSRLYFV